MGKHADDPTPEGTEPLGASYVVGQLAQSLRAAAAHTDPAMRDASEKRARGFLSVLQNLLSGALRVGHRQPYAGTPPWVTPEVVRGGFATGAHAAGGALGEHEVALATRLGVSASSSRAALNGHHLTRAGLEELASRLASRTYRIDVPEEGALLAVRWLIARGEHATAASLVETLEPFFDTLRFYPRPAATPLAEPVVGIETPVLARTARALAEGLEKKTPSVTVEAMREHYEVWAPRTDALVALVLETVVGEPPRFDGEGATRTVVGGFPFARFPDDFEDRRKALLADIGQAREAHPRCTRIHRESEVLGMLTRMLEALPRLDPAERARWARRARHRLAGFITAYGPPGSARHRAVRATQVAGPSHARIAHLVARRLVALPEPGGGLTSEDAAEATGAITAGERSDTVPAGTRVPSHLVRRVATTVEAPLGTLREAGVISSGEVLATLLPQLTGPALATRFHDPAARTLYAASYRAFRQRRSLLLLWLQHQIRFAELPWIAALEACGDGDPRPAVEETLRQLAAFAITAFPDTITPNKLVSELAALARVARPDDEARGGKARPWLPLVEEVASDIFMGTFSVKFLRAAQAAARVLRALPGGARRGGALYARYYAIDGARVLAMEKLVERWGTKTCPELDAYCLELAALPRGGNPRARNGAMIEQASILTTHNLAVLVEGLDLVPLLASRWHELADRALDATLDRLERRVIPESIPRIQRMRASKTLAFAWRQAIFFASFLDPAGQRAFVARARDELAARTPAARERFAPVVAGLEHVVDGDVLPREASHRSVAGMRRLLGWSVETPFLLDATRP
jgi:hypothetical protein